MKCLGVNKVTNKVEDAIFQKKKIKENVQSKPLCLLSVK